MPAHPLLIVHDPVPLDQPSQQQPVCAKCLSTLDAPGLPGPGAFVCPACRELLLSSPRDSVLASDTRIDLALAFPRSQSRDGSPLAPSMRPMPDTEDSMLLGDAINHRIPDAIRPSDPSSKPIRKPTLSCITNNVSALAPPPTHSSAQHSTPSTAIDSRRKKCTIPDPMADITRLRVRPSTHHCLYPGATFVGTQKSGRSSYDVAVTVVDVDFASSFLCGYLRIRGLTDDWPELTTFFDAEIIGNRYGFLTQNWGASEQDDMVHWSRFPAFKHVKHELKQPLLTMADRERGAVFMRWKERFLVPDHRVHDISGASFAGFYYVCVDFNPLPNHVPYSGPSAPDPASAETVPSSPRRNRRNASRRRGRSPSMAPISTPIATMNGFYYHQNSEPYQQLSLTHVPERTCSGFEFR